jgi:hypothetical protein
VSITDNCLVTQFVSLLVFLVCMCSITNLDSLMFMIDAFAYILIGLPGHFPEMKKFMSSDTTTVSNRLMK